MLDPVMEGTSVFLRSVEQDDLPLLVQWRNDPSIRGQFFNREPLHLESQDAWLSALRHDVSRSFWMICRKDTRKPAGTIALSGIDPVNRSAEFGNMLIGDGGSRRQGLAREAAELILHASFSRWGMHRIELSVFADNRMAIALYERLGFRTEGCLRDAFLREGHFRDILVMAILESEYAMPNG